jgi:hypothetical protein
MLINVERTGEKKKPGNENQSLLNLTLADEAKLVGSQLRGCNFNVENLYFLNRRN